jgi:type VI protein secretion system component Hcp
MKPAFVFALMLAASVAVAADPVVYTGCLSTSNGTLYSVHDGATPMQPCKDKDLQISWNMAGVPGERGDPGPQGQPGQDCVASNLPAVQVIGRLLIPTNNPSTDISSDILGVAASAQNVISIGAGGGGSTGKVEVSPLTVVKKLDSSSPRLFFRLVTGQVATSAEVLIFREGSQPGPNDDPHPFAEFGYKLKNAFVASLDASSSDPLITEKVGLVSQEICFDYYPLSGSPTEACFDVAQGNQV